MSHVKGQFTRCSKQDQWDWSLSGSVATRRCLLPAGLAGGWRASAVGVVPGGARGYGRGLGGAGPREKWLYISYTLTWFLPAILTYRKLLVEVLLTSFFLQLFALLTPLFFQVVTDKVLAHKGVTTMKL
jgi:hypothetical protein